MSGSVTPFSWNGGNDAYTDPLAWTPNAVPLYGEVEAKIMSGTATLTDAEPNGPVVLLAGLAPAGAPTLVLDNAALGPSLDLEILVLSSGGDFPPDGYANLLIQGYDTNYGTIGIPGGKLSPFSRLTITLAPYAQLNQEGSIGVGGDLLVQGSSDQPGRINNDGIITVSGSAEILTDITGGGTMSLAPRAGFLSSSSLEVGGAVASTQHIAFPQAFPFQGLPASVGSLLIEDPASFAGVIDHFDLIPTFDTFHPPQDSITLAHIAASSSFFAQITPSFGALLLLNGESVVGALTLSGTHPSDGFVVSNTAQGAMISPFGA